MSLMLSSQTKDGVTAKAMSNLQEYGLTIEGLIDIKQDKLEQLIFPVGFYRVIIIIIIMMMMMMMTIDLPLIFIIITV